MTCARRQIGRRHAHPGRHHHHHRHHCAALPSALSVHARSDQPKHLHALQTPVPAPAGAKKVVDNRKPRHFLQRWTWAFNHVYPCLTVEHQTVIALK